MSLLMNQYVSHRFDILLSIIACWVCIISTSVRLIEIPSRAKTDFGFTGTAIVFLLTIPILALESGFVLLIALNPSLLQYGCKEA